MNIELLKPYFDIKENVDMTTIPEEFKEDFLNFMFGKTHMKDGNKDMAYPSDVRYWAQKLCLKLVADKLKDKELFPEANKNAKEYLDSYLKNNIIINNNEKNI